MNRSLRLKGNLSGLHMIKMEKKPKHYPVQLRCELFPGEDYLKTLCDQFSSTWKSGTNSVMSEYWRECIVGIKKISIDNPLVLVIILDTLVDIGGENRLNGAPHPRFRPANVGAN